MTKYKKVVTENHPNRNEWGYLSGDAGWVYAVRFGDKVKIGRTKSPHSRMCELQTQQKAAFDEIHLIVCDNVRWAERSLHYQLRDCCVQGEWFRLSDIQMRAIRTIWEYKNSQFR